MKIYLKVTNWAGRHGFCPSHFSWDIFNTPEVDGRDMEIGEGISRGLGFSCQGYASRVGK